MAKKKYFTNESLAALINQIKISDDETLTSAQTYTDTEVAKKADSSHTHNDTYYTKSEVDDMELITVDDIDAICGTTILVATASEVTF